MKTLTPSTGQEKKYRRLVEDSVKHATDLALGKTEAEQDGWQRVLEHGDELRDAIAEVVVAKTKELSISNQFADEEAESNLGYLSGYKPKSIAEQLIVLRQLFPDISSVGEKLTGQSLPSNAEGYFVIPRREKIASTYGEAVQKVLDIIKQTRSGKFYNYRENCLGPQYLHQSAKTAKALQTLGDQQKDYDILVVPAQFGLRHRGRSVRRAREVMSVSEFGLNAFSIGIILLTHPERLQHYDDLWIDCAGDEYSDDGGGRFEGAPYFGFSDGGVKFGACSVGDADGLCGSASAFLPQSEF